MERFAYIGCRTTKERNARGKGISVYRITDGKWELIQLLEGPVNPSYLCLNQSAGMLYAIHGDYSEVSSYRVALDGTLSYGNTVKTHGTNPVHLSLDKSGKWLFVANLQTGGISVISVKEDGFLGKIKELYFLPGNGGPGYISHPHQVAQDRTGRWLMVPSQGRLQGIGKITVFEIDSQSGTLRETSVIKARGGAEPRHCVLHPGNRFCYCVNEKDSTVSFYEFNQETGILTPRQLLTTLPEDYAGDGWASALDMDPLGNYLYVSNRKHDSITVYQINQENGKLSLIHNIKSGGEQPRFITVSPEDGTLLAANELTDTIECFDIDDRTGKLTHSGLTIRTESPVCIIFKN